MADRKASNSSYLKQYQPLHAWEKHIKKINNVNNILAANSNIQGFSQQDICKLKKSTKVVKNNPSKTSVKLSRNNSKADSITMSISSNFTIPHSGTS